MSTPQPAAPKKKSKLTLILLMVLPTLIGAGGAAAWFIFAQPQAATHGAPVKKKDALFLALDPAFVVNLNDERGSRYLQADIQVMTRDAKTLAALDKQQPVLRNKLLMLLSQQSPHALNDRAAKEKLQQLALAEIRTVLKSEGLPDAAEAVIFTSFVIQ
ncbi:MAG: flagellar basal body-associated FliL family protein [Pseudomonadota bacterium]|nr:flagellar basal body-associated FliL family protein [Pseudomonadota bacterium]